MRQLAGATIIAAIFGSIATYGVLQVGIVTTLLVFLGSFGLLALISLGVWLVMNG